MHCVPGIYGYRGINHICSLNKVCLAKRKTDTSLSFDAKVKSFLSEEQVQTFGIVNPGACSHGTELLPGALGGWDELDPAARPDLAILYRYLRSIYYLCSLSLCIIHV